MDFTQKKCFYKRRECIFHGRGVSDGTTVAIVEYIETGDIHLRAVEYISFGEIKQRLIEEKISFIG